MLLCTAVYADGVKKLMFTVGLLSLLASPAVSALSASQFSRAAASPQYKLNHVSFDTTPRVLARPKIAIKIFPVMGSLNVPASIKTEQNTREPCPPC